MEIIDELEPVRRGFYGGTVGYFGHGGDMDQAITIRTLVFHGDDYSYQAGAGIVADSVPAAEYQEVLAKSAVLRARARARAGGLVDVHAAPAADRQLRFSFTYNLVQAFMVLGAEVLVHRNDAITVEEAKALAADASVHLARARARRATRACRCDMIRAFAGQVPVLGVCLGHQSIVEVFGGEVVRAAALMHGKTSPVEHDGAASFAGLPQPFEVGPLSLADREARDAAGRARGHGAHAAKARSWACVTASSRSKACSSTRRAC